MAGFPFGILDLDAGELLFPFQADVGVGLGGPVAEGGRAHVFGGEDFGGAEFEEGGEIEEEDAGEQAGGVFRGGLGVRFFGGRAGGRRFRRLVFVGFGRDVFDVVGLLLFFGGRDVECCVVVAGGWSFRVCFHHFFKEEDYYFGLQIKMFEVVNCQILLV